MSLQTIIQDAPIADDVKQKLLHQLENEGETEAVISEVRTALQDYIDSGFKTLGITVDPKDPKVEEALETYNKALDAAQAEYEEELENLNIDAAVAQAKANKAIDTASADIAKAQLASA